MSKIFLITIMIAACLYVGLFLGLKRALVNKFDMKINEGIVQSKKKTHFYTIKGGRHDYLEFTLENYDERIAISYISQSQAENDSTYNIIKIGEKYKFYIDKSYPNSNGISCGINFIEDKGILIFKKSHTFELLFGLFFTLLSILITILGIRKIKLKTPANKLS